MSGPHLIQSEFPGDDGRADPGLADALRGYADGSHGEYTVLPALAAARLLVPVVAVAADEVTPRAGDEPGSGGESSPDDESECDHHGSDKRSELALPTLVGADGRRGVLAFTSAEALARWREDARPVPVHARQACQATIEEGADALVVDIAGPVPFAVDGYRLRSLAESGAVPAAHEDPDVLAAMRAAFDPEEGIKGVRVGPGDKAELSVRCAVDPHLDERAAARRVADRLAMTLRGRTIGGVELGVARARPQPESSPVDAPVPGDEQPVDSVAGKTTSPAP